MTQLTEDSQTPLQFELGYPAPGTAEKAYDAADLRRAIEAYKFFYPTLGSEAVMQQMLSNGAKINEVGHVMATWPRIQFGAANSDTPYALATLDLKSAGPMVVELPAGPFIGFVDDHNMRWVQDMGTIGPEKGKGGKHLILPPGWCSSAYFPSAATSPRRSCRPRTSKSTRWPRPDSRSPFITLM